MGRGRRSAVAWIAMLLLAACAAPGSTPQTSEDGARAASASVAPGPAQPTAVPPFGPGGPPASPPQAGQAGQATQPVVFLPPGPASPVDPPTGSAYESISRLRCEDAAPFTGTGNEAIWTAVAAVCSAAVTGSAPQWAQAAALLAAAPDVPAQRCLEAAAVAGAHRVLAFHTAHPDAAITFAQATEQACPRRLTGATVLDAAGTPSGPSRTQVSGPVTGRTALRLDGFTGAVSGVLVNGVPDPDGTIALDGANSFDPVTITMPPASGPGTVRISLSGPLAIAGWIDFTYVAAGSATAPPGPSQRTTPPASPASAAPPSGGASPGGGP